MGLAGRGRVLTQQLLSGVLLHEQRDELADSARIEFGVRLCDSSIDRVRGGIGELDAEPVLDLGQGLTL